jgi:hypothetical protein
MCVDHLQNVIVTQLLWQIGAYMENKGLVKWEVQVLFYITVYRCITVYRYITVYSPVNLMTF